MVSLQLQHVSKTVLTSRARPGLVVLADASLAIKATESIAIQGRSGSGKSTLLAVLGLLDSPTSGTYTIDGIDVLRLRARERDRLRARTFSFVFQKFCLLSHLSAQENVEAALVVRMLSRAQRRARSREALEAVGLGSRIGHRPQQLSGGEQQRVALARALVSDPAVILADEPTGSLDERTGHEVMAQLRSAAAAGGKSLVVVTHDSELARTFDRRLSIDGGRVVEV
jgi:putative ABC transport system ATP-binding protein